MATKSELTWTEINPDSLAEVQLESYQAYKAAYAVMKEARQVFELSMQVGVPQGYRIVCGYNFGKLSVAMALDDRKPAKVKTTGSLADFLASAQASGRRA